MGEPGSVSTPLAARIAAAAGGAGGWLPFDRFMAMALYEPGLGYYARGAGQFGTMRESGSDFVTAPELTPVFGATLAVQVRQAIDAAGSGIVWEFGAGSGALAEQLLDSLGERVASYHVVELSAALRERQRQRLQRFGGRVHWHDTLPDVIDGVVVGNEVLDAMPVQLLAWDGERWHERGVVVSPEGGFAWADQPTDLRPPAPDESFLPGAVTEIHRQAEAFMRTLAERMHRGVALFVDYGFPEHEYYHRQRHGGTLMCHRGHRADTDPLADVGAKDITAHVNFSAVALAAQSSGLDVIGYTSQGRFLLNCGLAGSLGGADARTIAAVQKLVSEHEMGELFKVLALARGVALDAVGFAVGDRSHTL